MVFSWYTILSSSKYISIQVSLRHLYLLTLAGSINLHSFQKNHNSHTYPTDKKRKREPNSFFIARKKSLHPRKNATYVLQNRERNVLSTYPPRHSTAHTHTNLAQSQVQLHSNDSSQNQKFFFPNIIHSKRYPSATDYCKNLISFSNKRINFQNQPIIIFHHDSLSQQLKLWF